MKRALTLPKVAGIQIFIHWTFSILIIYIIYSNLRAGLNALQIGWSVLFVLGLFVCVVLHELGHALAARRYGIQTKDITLYPIGGVARLERMPERPVQELVVALAGPAVNFLITLLLSPILLNYAWPTETSETVVIIGADNFLPMLGVVNIWLALFNLIPAFPMDGGRVLRALLSMKMKREKATVIAAGIGKMLAFGFVLAGFYLNPFLIFIGLFIILGANAEEQMVKTQSMIADLTANDAIMTNFITIDKNESISSAIKLLLDGQSKNFLITDNGKPCGTINRDDIIKGIQQFGESCSIEKITNMELVSIDHATPLGEVFMEFRKQRIPLILVTKKNQVIGIIDADNIAEVIMVHTARKQIL